MIFYTVFIRRISIFIPNFNVYSSILKKMSAINQNYFVDQMGRKIYLKESPKRIISLVPSQTELLYDLGLGDRVVGITKFCVHPKSWFTSKTRVGGTKTYHFDKIEALRPDLIIGNKEENEEIAIKQLMEQYPVWMSNVKNLEDAYAMLDSIGQLTQTEQKAKQIIQQLKANFSERNNISTLSKATYFIWNDPLMIAGGDTFINEMMEVAGFKNAYTYLERYPTLEEKDFDPTIEFVLLSSEPFPFKEKHILQFQDRFPNAKTILVDGEYFSWYGSRLLGAANYFKEMSFPAWI